MKYLSPDVSVMKCPGKVLYKPKIRKQSQWQSQLQ